MTATPYSGALPAFVGTRPHLADPQGRWFVWLTSAGGLYDFTPAGVHIDDDFSTLLEGPASELLDRAFGTARKLTFVHDWRFVRSYSGAVRAKLVAWGLSHYGRTRVETITAILESTSPLMVKMACTVGASLMAVGGVEMRVRTPDELTWEKALLPMGLQDPAL